MKIVFTHFISLLIAQQTHTDNNQAYYNFFAFVGYIKLLLIRQQVLLWHPAKCLAA